MNSQQQTSEKARIAFHESAIHAVRAKMLRVYPPSGGEENLPPAIQNSILLLLQRAQRSESWKGTSGIATSHSGLTSEIQPKLDAVARDIAMHYAESFYIQRYILSLKDNEVPKRYGNFYRWDRTRGDLIHTAVNHVSNLAEAKLRDIGLTPYRAHAIHGHIIGQIIRSYNAALEAHGTTECGESAVYPSQGSVRFKSTTEVTDEIQELAAYWKGCKHEIQRGYRNFNRQR